MSARNAQELVETLDAYLSSVEDSEISSVQLQAIQVETLISIADDLETIVGSLNLLTDEIHKWMDAARERTQ